MSFLRFVIMGAAFISVLPVSATESALEQNITLGGFQELLEARDEILLQRLKSVIRHLGLEPAVRAGRLSVSIADVTDPRALRYAGLNDEQMHYAASLPKITIMLAAFYRAEITGQPMPSAIYDDIVKMIRYSNNMSATRVLSWAGNDFLVRMLQSDAFRLYDQSHNGGLWIGRGYTVGTDYQRDPLHNTSHGANTLQIARFWYLLATNRLINPKRSQEMKRLTGNPVFNNKFVRGLGRRSDLHIYRKTGTFKHYHGDGALIETGTGKNLRRYIMAALATDIQGGEWIRQLATPLYDALSKNDKAE